MRLFRLVLVPAFLAALALSTRAAAPSAATRQRVSIAAVAASPTDAAGRPNRTYISRRELLAQETSAETTVEVALAMRNFAELEARLAHSDLISTEEMQARYLPLAADHDRVVRWLQSEGLAIARTDANHLAVFARGSVADFARVFQTSFARVVHDGTEYTAAIATPTIPAHLASAIRGVHGLQPYQRWRRRPHAALQPLAGTGNSIPYYPAQIAHAYGSDSLTLNGTGQTIAIYALAFPATSDLSTFFQTTGNPATTANIQTINVAGGPAKSPDPGNVEEATLDVEWAAALAPAAAIRVYGASEDDPVGDDELIQQVLADLATQPSLHQLTISFGIDETSTDRDYMAIEAQYMATLVSAGVTVFASTGDNGALNNNESAIGVGFPATMPDVTAVGGTTLTLDASGNFSSETGWGSLNNAGTSGSSAGGVSTVFLRPSWQNVAGVPSGTNRLIPDVAAVGDPATGALVIYRGSQHQVGGTSLSSPVWAAFCAMMNQARATAGKSPVGALNPRIYPLAGTAAFRDVTSGGNSVFQAGVGYDLVTGIGSPNVPALITALATDTFAPVIEIQSKDRFTTVGQAATFYVIGTSSPNPTYQWQRLPAGAVTWTDVIESTTYTGSKTYALQINGATLAMTGDQFRCIVTNANGTVTSQPDKLTVATTGVSTLAGWPGWSGFADGQGSIGRFNYTGSVRVAPNGTVYVADASNHTIRKVTPDGVVTTVAGSPGITGSADGAGSLARFNGPAGVAIDAAGNLYIADSANFTVRKITPAGLVTTFAGQAGTAGHADGAGGAATFTDPENITIDSAGNLYVCDGSGNAVRKITPAGLVTTLAGSPTSGTADGVGTAARFNLLAGIAVDLQGNVYVGDMFNNSIRKITPTGTVTTLAGLSGTSNLGFVDGIGSSARFAWPAGMAVDANGTVYVADSLNNAIRAVSASGVVTTLGGTAAQSENIDGALAVSRFNGPADVALGATNGILYVADAFNCTVRRIVLPTPSVATTASQTVALGTTFALNATASGAPPYTYQWSKDGTPIVGATSSTLAVTSASAASAGNYTVAVTNLAGTTTSAATNIKAVAATPSQLANLSVRTKAGSGAQVLTVGFVINGTSNKPLVVRGIGPALSGFGVSGVVSDPVLTLFGPNSSTTVAATNDNWNASDATAISAVGAFPLAVGSKDSALVATLVPGSYSAQITGSGGATGIALAEVYDANLGAAARLVNVSARAQVATGAGILIAGFTIDGSVSKTVLIRGVGPTLGTFGVTGVLNDPRLDVYDSTGTIVFGNDDWLGASALSAAFSQTGAFALTASSKDAAMLLTLPPGSYTAQVSGVSNTTGVALVEIYEMP